MTDATTQAGSLPVVRTSPTRRLAIAVSLALVILAAAAALFLVRTVDSQLADISSTYEVRRQARDLTVLLLDAETGQRGYLLTGDETYLAPYEAALATLDSSYQRLRDMSEGNAEQSARVESLAADIAAKSGEMQRTVDLVRAGRTGEAVALVDTDRGRQVMDRLRTTLGALLAEEDARLLERSGMMSLYRQSLVAAILAALGAAATLAYALFTRTQQQVRAMAQRQSALLLQNEELEAHVRRRTSEVEEARRHAERERARLEALLQETNHRIGNSLATVSSLLGLQLARSGSDEVKVALEAAQSRVQAIASGHRRLRLGADLETTNAAEFLESVIDDLAATLPSDRRVAFDKRLEPLVIPARDATTIGIIVGELVTNALKHAFASGQDGNICVRLLRGPDGRPQLAVEDDGRGFDDANRAGPPGGLGALIIRQLARQFGGETTYHAREGGGTVVVVTLPGLQSVDAAA